VPFGLERLRSREWWLGKIGIGLLLFGAAFLFKFSVDQNWITPSVRVGIGLALGALLVVLGLRVYADRRAFSQVLLGGGVGVFYITGLRGLPALRPRALRRGLRLHGSVTLLAMAAVLAPGWVRARPHRNRRRARTPFILYAGAGSVGGLVLYTCLILAGACGIYAYRGWTSLLAFAYVTVSFAGTWTVFLIGYSDLLYWNDASRRRTASRCRSLSRSRG
jgi:uncharacterized membrane protein